MRLWIDAVLLSHLIDTYVISSDGVLHQCLLMRITDDCCISPHIEVDIHLEDDACFDHHKHGLWQLKGGLQPGKMFYLSRMLTLYLNMLVYTQSITKSNTKS